MGQETWGWTDLHTRAAVAVLAALGGAVVGLVEQPPIPYWIGLAVAFATVLGLFFDEWGGALTGLAVAVLVVALRRLADHWTAEDFLPAALETLAMVAAGAAAGHAGRALRRAGAVPGGDHSGFGPVHGSLGLLGAGSAMVRLEEELERGHRQLRPVTVAVFDVVVTDEALPGSGRTAACRAVARAIESRAGERDIPFALEANRLGLILPDSTVGAVWDVIGRVLESLQDATFVSEAGRSSLRLADFVELFVGISRQSPVRSTASSILDDAAAALARARAEGAVP